MDKREVERYMPLADEAISKVLNGKEIDKTFRSKLSAFGATVIMSGLVPAIVYYVKEEQTMVVVNLLAYMYIRTNNISEEEINNVVKKTDEGILTVRFTMRGQNIRIFGAGYWRQGKKRYEEHL